MTRKGLSRRPRPSDIRRKILHTMGIEESEFVVRRRKPRTPATEKLTWAMLALAVRFGIRIFKILDDGSLSKVSKRYGISPTTAWRWRERLGMNAGKHRHEYLPSESLWEGDGDGST